MLKRFNADLLKKWLSNKNISNFRTEKWVWMKNAESKQA